MPAALNTKQIAHIDCAGGGQVWVDGTTLYVGHMRHAERHHDCTTSPIRRTPRQIAPVPIPEGWHSHKVRAPGRHHDRQS